MNYTIIGNPYDTNATVVNTRGVMTDAKVAKLNNDKKKPALVSNWEKLRPNVVETTKVTTLKDYNSLLDEVGIKTVNYGVNVTNTGAKKLRVNKLVNDKTKKIYDNSSKEDVIPMKEEPEIKIESALTPNVTSDDLRGRHEKTAPIPVNEIQEAIKEEPVNNPVSYTSRMERNVMADNIKDSKQESKAGDMDLYNNLLHSVNQTDDVSRQLQGARNQLSIEKEESRKLAEQYGEAVKELAKLKEDIEVTKREKEQKAKEELSMTLKSIENLQKENLERTSDLTSIQSEIARLKAEKQAMEANDFE